MFNQYAQNGFYNKDYETLVLLTMEVIDFHMRNNGYPSLEQAIADIIPKMVEMACADNIRTFQPLQGMVNPNSAEAIQRVINNLDALLAEIRPKPGFNIGGYNNQQVNNYGNGAPVFPSSNRQGGHVSVNGGGGNQRPPIQMAQIFGSTENRVYGGARTAENTDIARVYEPINNTVATQEQSKTASKVLWVPNKQHWYLPAYNPNLYELQIANVNGVITPFINNKKDVNMDYASHSTDNSSGIVPTGLGISAAASAMQRIHVGVQEVNNEVIAIAEEEKEMPVVTTKINQKILLEISEEAAWLTAGLCRYDASLFGDKIVIPAIYRCYAFIYKPVICSQSDREFIRNISNSKTFISVRDKIIAFKDEVHPELLNLCKREITELINRLLKQKVCIPRLTIDDFIEDIEGVIVIIKTKFGDRIAEAFLKDQQSQITSTLKMLDLDEAYTVTLSHMDGETKEGRCVADVVYIGGKYSLTFVQCLYDELEIKLQDDIASLVKKEGPDGNPILHSLLVSMFADTEAQTTKDGVAYRRHLLKTKDGRILEATKGSIGDDAYMLKLIM
jgi:hypothetical protein